MESRKLGRHGPEVSPIGLGCMGMSFAYGQADEAQSIATLQRAVELGVTHFDTAEMYGPFTNEELVGRALAPFGGRVTIATKFGFRIGDTGVGRERITGLDSSPANVRDAVEGSLRRLGVETIDLLYQHRVDPLTPIEDTVGAMADLVNAGKVRALGLSECSAATLRRAHAVHPIASVQSEYSLWTRDPEAEVLPACIELGVTLVAYSPLGRGFLSGKMESTEQLAADDFRRTLPRFQDAAFARNRALVEALTRVAEARGVTPAQLALAWVLAQGERVVTIPGATKTRHLEENVAAAALTLSSADRAAIDEALPPEAVVGQRFTAQGLATVNR